MQIALLTKSIKSTLQLLSQLIENLKYKSDSNDFIRINTSIDWLEKDRIQFANKLLDWVELAHISVFWLVGSIPLFSISSHILLKAFHPNLCYIYYIYTTQIISYMVIDIRRDFRSQINIRTNLPNIIKIQSWCFNIKAISWIIYDRFTKQNNTSAFNCSTCQWLTIILRILSNDEYPMFRHNGIIPTLAHCFHTFHLDELKKFSKIQVQG